MGGIKQKNDYPELKEEIIIPKSQYAGVFWDLNLKKWKAHRLVRNGTPVTSGYWEDEMQAAKESDRIVHTYALNNEKHEINFPDEYRDFDLNESSFMTQSEGESCGEIDTNF